MRNARRKAREADAVLRELGFRYENDEDPRRVPRRDAGAAGGEQCSVRTPAVPASTDQDGAAA